MTRLQKPVFPLMNRVGTPKSPSVGALFLLWLQMRCGWNFLGLQKPTRVNVTTLTSLTLHFHGTLHCTFHFHYTPLLLSMAPGLWKDGQKSHQKIIWEMSVKKVLMLQPLIHWCYISGFWAGKLRSNTFIHTLTQLHARDVVNKIFVLIMWSKVPWFWLEIIATVFTCKHLWTNHPAVSSTELAFPPSLVKPDSRFSWLREIPHHLYGEG